jgi:hypothetical protein
MRMMLAILAEVVEPEEPPAKMTSTGRALGGRQSSYLAVVGEEEDEDEDEVGVQRSIEERVVI